MTINDIVQKIYFLTNTNSTSFSAPQILILINNAYNRVTSLIIKADTKWQWDDSNNTDLPIATTQVNANQKDYSLATSHLKILRARIKDTSGNWKVLKPIDQADQDYTYKEDSTTTGVPLYYDKFGISIFLSPTPNYTQAASLELTFQRGPAEFTSGDVSTGTKSPGFNSLYHDLIPLWVAFDYWLVNDPAMTTPLMTQIQLKEQALSQDYALRGKDEVIRFVPGCQNNK